VTIEVFAIAEEELIIAFKMIGIEGSAVSSREEAESTFSDITKQRRLKKASGQSEPDSDTTSYFELEDLKILILSEDIADMLGDALLDWQLSGNYPLVVEIPPLSGTSADHVSLVDAVRRAIGIRIQ
jgi:V/A-type H+-transporting ATPase subunit F